MISSLLVLKHIQQSIPIKDLRIARLTALQLGPFNQDASFNNMY